MERRRVQRESHSLAGCDHLSADHKCTIYSHRPTICRLYGLSEKLKCPFGCIPTRTLSEQESHQILQESFKIGGRPVLIAPNDER